MRTDFPEHEKEPEHVTAADDVKPEYEPATQGVHVELPLTSEYVPLAQFVQAAEPFAEKVPAGQRLHDFGPTGVQLVLQVPVKPA